MPMLTVAFHPDRLNKTNESLSFTGNGYYQVPSGVYVSGDFTLLAWVNIKFNVYSPLKSTIIRIKSIKI